MATKLSRFILLSCSAWLLAACSTPYSERLSSIDWSQEPAVGTIAISTPKMYRREALINERREEVAWLNELLEKSKTIELKPELLRELEQVTAFAGALGLNFDPTNGLANRRARETGDIQQQIDVVKMQLQLDQLKRDAELARSKFAAQTDLVNTDLGKAATATPATGPSNTAAAADQLKAAVDRLTTALTARLDAKSEGPSVAQSSVNPVDSFRDHVAYRDVLKSARNAASLDDLHDYMGNALIRLNFQVMVVPDRADSQVAGVVQMTVESPKPDAEDRQALYSGWLEYLNQRVNRPTDTGWIADPGILASPAADNFDQLEYRFSLPPQPSASGPTPGTTTRGKSQAPHVKSDSRTEVPPNCPGLDFSDPSKPKMLRGAAANAAGTRSTSTSDESAVNERCSRLVFVVPKFRGVSEQEGAFRTLKDYVNWFDLDNNDSVDNVWLDKARHLIRDNVRAIVKDCGLPSATSNTGPLGPGDPYLLFQAVGKAQNRVVAGETVAVVDRTAQRMLHSLQIRPPRGTLTKLIAARTARARLFVATFRDEAYKGCTSRQIDAFNKSGPQAFVPPGFEAVLSGDRVAVYEVGPREQVQQVSTVSRVANNLSLAASLAASAPSTGLAAQAAANYSRQAIGKAAALERVPGLIGYSVLNAKTFGWVIGPKATVDPKGSVRLEQSPRTLDLTVELSIPSWWRHFSLLTITGWSPSRVKVTTGAVTALGGAAATSVRVPRDLNDADYASLTARMVQGGLVERRQAELDDDSQFAGQAVNACLPSNIFIAGPNIWRASIALLGGYKLDETAITVAPDMSGILLAVPALDQYLGDAAPAKVPLTVLTRYGDVHSKIDYVRKPVAGCNPPDKKANGDGPALASIVPSTFAAGSELEFTISGSKLDKINRVTLNGQTGKLDVNKSGKSATAKFSAVQTASLPVSRTVPLTFFKDDEKLGERLMEVTTNLGVRK